MAIRMLNMSPHWQESRSDDEARWFSGGSRHVDASRLNSTGTRQTANNSVSVAVREQGPEQTCQVISAR